MERFVPPKLKGYVFHNESASGRQASHLLSVMRGEYFGATYGVRRYHTIIICLGSNDKPGAHPQTKATQVVDDFLLPAFKHFRGEESCIHGVAPRSWLTHQGRVLFLLPPPRTVRTYWPYLAWLKLYSSRVLPVAYTLITQGPSAGLMQPDSSLRWCRELYEQIDDGSNLRPSEDVLADGIHLNPRGYAMLNKYLIGVIIRGGTPSVGPPDAAAP